MGFRSSIFMAARVRGLRVSSTMGLRRGRGAGHHLDRPGYGGSGRQRGRQVADCVADVAAIADRLEIKRFAVAGGSVGGPHCLAVAAGLPERGTRASCAVGLDPFDAPDVDWFAGMDPMNVREITSALEGEDVLTRDLEREAADMLAQVRSDPSTFLSD